MNHSDNENANQIIGSASTVFWFRRDLRLRDNTALFHALRDEADVIPVFIFDTSILSRLSDKSDRRVDFIHRALLELSSEIASYGSTLMVYSGIPQDIFRKLKPAKIYANDDYEPYARKRDEAVARVLKEWNGSLHLFKDHVIFEKKEITRKDGSPYTVFTPYSKAWKAALQEADISTLNSEGLLSRLKKLAPVSVPRLTDIGFQTTDTIFPPKVFEEERLNHYNERRNFPGVDGTSRLSVHFRFGTISIRRAVSAAVAASNAWLNELIWRDFYQMILWNFPHVERSAFKPAYNNIAWRNDEEEFSRWCEGTTGYPLVDAGMREMNATGFMHNRLRMVTASFLTKHLLIDYRWGEAYFAEKLLDFDLAANNGGWQWAAGSGCDAAPYFRIFNPSLQQSKFDPEGAYVRRWVPEAGTAAYPAPVVPHEHARQRALAIYKQSLADHPQKHRVL